MDAYEADFPAIREQVLETFRQLAADSARRLAATGQPVPPAFEEAVVDEVVASLPTPEVLRERLMLQYRVGVMQLGSELWAEARLAADERRRTQEIESEARLARERTAVAERLVQEQLWSEQERLRRQREAEEQERQREAAIKERLRQLKLEAARDRLQEALSPLEEGARQLHAAVYEAASAIRSSLQKHQALRGPSARKVRELCRWYSMMNWQDARANLIQALLGLTVTEMENVLAKAAVRDRGFGPNTGRLVLDEKRDLIRKTAALTFTPPIPIEHVGGYQPIRRLLRLAALTFSPEARAFGVEEAKGLLLVGLPGCGKDTIARAASSVLGRALLQLDLGAVMGEGGGPLGSAELSIKRALQIATTAKCVLHLSEYEKAVGGMQSSARADGGATSRVVASLSRCSASPTNSAARGCCPVTSDADGIADARESSEQSEGPEDADPCGCAPRPAVATGPAEARDAQIEPSDANQEPPTPDDAPRGELKLVVLLRRVHGGYRAHLAVSSDGCDPELRVTDVPDLPTALLVLTELAAAAQARWRVQPRYPAALRPVSSPCQPPVASRARPSRPVDPALNSAGDGRRTPAESIAAAPGQLSLFG